MELELNIEDYTHNTRVRAYALSKISAIIDNLYEDVDTLQKRADALRENGDEISDKLADKADDERYAYYELIGFLSGVKV